MLMHSLFIQIFSHATPGAYLARILNDAPMPSFLADAPHISAGPAPWHHGSALDHICRCMDNVAGDPLAVWMALAHDSGKLTTPRAMLPHHYGHELRGEILAPIWAKQLNLSHEYAQAGKLAAFWHMRAAWYDTLRPGKRFKILRAIHTTPYADAFWKMVAADSKTQVNHLPFADWKVIENAKADGLDREGQIQELARQSPRRLAR